MDMKDYELFHSILWNRANDKRRAPNERQAYRSALDMLEYAAIGMTEELRQFDY